MLPPQLGSTVRNSSRRTWPRLVDGFRQMCGYRFPRLGSTAFNAIIRSLPKKVESRLFPKITATLDLADETQRTTYWFGTRFERPTPQILQQWAEDADVFFDVGSNYGFYSFFLYSVAPHVDIYAFEPNPLSFRRLQDICVVNNAARIKPQPYGLSDEDGRFNFLQLFENTGHSSFAPCGELVGLNQRLAGGTVIQCEVFRFDQVIRRLELSYPTVPRWIAKIDVEGYELKVVQGMAEALERKAFKGICIELLEENLGVAGATIAQVDDFLRDYGYQPIRSEPVHKHSAVSHHNAFYVPKRINGARKT